MKAAPNDPAFECCLILFYRLFFHLSPDSDHADEAGAEEPDRTGDGDWSGVSGTNSPREVEADLIGIALEAVVENEEPRPVRIGDILRTRPAVRGLQVGERSGII